MELALWVEKKSNPVLDGSSEIDRWRSRGRAYFNLLVHYHFAEFISMPKWAESSKHIGVADDIRETFEKEIGISHLDGNRVLWTRLTAGEDGLQHFNLLNKMEKVEFYRVNRLFESRELFVFIPPPGFDMKILKTISDRPIQRTNYRFNDWEF